MGPGRTSVVGRPDYDRGEGTLAFGNIDVSSQTHSVAHGDHFCTFEFHDMTSTVLSRHSAGSYLLRERKFNTTIPKRKYQHTSILPVTKRIHVQRGSVGNSVIFNVVHP